MGAISEKIRNVLHEIILSSTFHAIPNIIRSERLFFKIMWTLCFLLSFSYCFTSICRSINSFLDREIVTNIKIISEIPTQFPSVSFCNLNPFVTDYALDKLDQFKRKLGLNFSNLDTSNQTLFKKIKKIKSDFLMHSMYELLTDENKKQFSYPLEDILIECSFGRKNCISNDFFWYFDTQYGNCFTFNKGKNSKGEIIPIIESQKAGIQFGLNVQFFIGNPSKIDEIIRSSGVHVIVHNSTLDPRPEDGVVVSSGEETNIIVNRVFDSQLDYPYSNCKLNLNTLNAIDSEFYRKIFLSNKTYTRKYCRELCFAAELVRKCNCTNIFEININYCGDENSCAMNTRDSDKNSNCVQLCPSECDTIFYSLSLSHSDYPNPKYAELLKTLPIIKSKFSTNSPDNERLNFNKSINTDYSELKKSIVSIKVFYDELKYTKVSQIEKMSLEDLVSNLGGIFGLFMGASFMSFFEIFEAIFQAAFIILDVVLSRSVQVETRTLAAVHEIKLI